MKQHVLGIAIVLSLSAPMFAQTGTPDSAGSTGSTTANTQRTDDSPHHDYGWVGLLGLAGLAGLRKQRHDHVADTTTGARRV